MIPSVQERKKNIHTFMNSYPYICRLLNVAPNPSIKIDSSSKYLDLVGDKLKLDDWKPILEAISNDRSLHYIRILSKHSTVKVIEEAETENHVRQMGNPKLRPFFTHYILLNMTEALSKCLCNSLALTGLLIEKIPLNSQLLCNLTQGLAVCPNLQQLSLPYTNLGDDGCAILCQVLRSRLNLVWLNLTGCDLTDKGVGLLCNLLKLTTLKVWSAEDGPGSLLRPAPCKPPSPDSGLVLSPGHLKGLYRRALVNSLQAEDMEHRFQKLNRYGESWKQSLRYRAVNPNIMPGLRRLTLNNNPIRDTGVKIFVDSVIDDLWLKALDLQNCNVTLVGGEALLNLVKENQFLAVVDIRGNMQVPNSLVAAIVQQLVENNIDTTPEFQWLKEDNPKRNLESITGTSRSRSSQRLVCNTPFSKQMSNTSVLPKKKVITVPQRSQILCTQIRPVSTNRFNTTNNTPRPPWNWNDINSTIRRRNSDCAISINNKCSLGKLSQFQSVKMQLQEVSQQLEEETERRIKIEKELEKYKQIVEIPDSFMSIDKSKLHSLFLQFCDNSMSKERSEVSKFKIVKTDDDLGMKKDDTLETVIKCINNESNPNLNSASRKCTTPPNDQNNLLDTSSSAKLLFETLISS